MSTLTGHISLFATQSLKSIDKWMETVQGNLTGSVRNGYKSTTLTFGGNTTSILRETTMLQNGVQIGEQALNVGHTETDWSNGEINNSTQDTHFAIQGQGFFLVTDPVKTGSGGFNGTTGTTGSVQGAYLTRDGEFHWGTCPAATGNTTDLILLTSNGLVVQADISDGPTAGNSDNLYAPVYYTDFNDPTKKYGPSVVQPSLDTGGVNQPNTIVDYKDLRYSIYGSTILEAPSSTTIKTIINGSAGNLTTRQVTSPNANGETFANFTSEAKLVPNALEASNVKFDNNIAELAALGKIYNGFVQVIKVYNSALDDCLGFIR